METSIDAHGLSSLHRDVIAVVCHSLKKQDIVNDVI